MPPKTVSPTQVGQYLKGLTDSDRFLSSIAVQGEVSNHRKYPSGHHYFSLKDPSGVISCIMFKSDAKSLRFTPENGMNVIATGGVTVFPRDGKYQLQCRKLQLEGAGELHQAFELLKVKLGQQGLFDPSHKKKIPFLPNSVALLTSSSGAVVQDMIRILKERCPLTRVFVVPVQVQGQGAGDQIAAAIGWANYYNIAQVLIVGRGGGSMEDLWEFNQESLARAIFDSEIPVISAVGHEPDVTIADFVADVRAATPTHAAELVVPELSALQGNLAYYREQLAGRFLRQIQNRRGYLSYLSKSPGLRDPRHHLREKAQLVDRYWEQLEHTMNRELSNHRHRTNQFAATLHALSPMEVMGRGYAIPRTQQGKLVNSVQQVEEGDPLSLSLKDGTIACQVGKISPIKPKGKQKKPSTS